jgi:hypothetical protein
LWHPPKSSHARATINSQPLSSTFIRYYLFLPNGYPEWRAEDETERLAWLMQNPLLGVYDNIHNAIAANDADEKATLERIRMNGSPRIVRAHSVSVY